MRYAEIDKPYTLQNSGTGVYQCYCKKNWQYEIFFDQTNFCYDYSGIYFIKAFSIVATLIISSLNVIIRTINILLVRYIGYSYESQFNRTIMMTNFLAQFFITGILIVLCDANFENNFLKFIPLSGNYHECNTDWYNLIAPTIVQSMVIQALLPFGNVALAFGVKFGLRLLDKGLCCCKAERGTRKICFEQYVTLYEVPEWLIYKRYSEVLNVSLVAFTHGTALPVLFPIALLAIFNHYWVERLCLAYLYKQPPFYDNRLSNQALQSLKLGPIFMMAFGYWYLGNRQMFFNEYSPIERANSAIQDPNHHIVDFSDGFSHPQLLLIAMILFIVKEQLISVVSKAMNLLGIVNTKKLEDILDDKISYDENLGLFWECLTGLDQKRWFTKEIHHRSQLHIQTMDSHQLEHLRTCKRGPKFIQNTCNYDILENIKYQSLFFYSTIDKQVGVLNDVVAQFINAAEESTIDQQDGLAHRPAKGEQESTVKRK